MFLKNRCIVQRDGEDCASIADRISLKFPEFDLFDINQLEPAYVKHIQKMNFFRAFQQNDEFCVISRSKQFF